MKQKITKITPEQFSKCSYVECIDTIYDANYGDGRKVPHSEISKFRFENGKVTRQSENGHKSIEFDTRSLNGATKKLNDDIQYYGNNNGGMPHFSSEYYIVYDDGLNGYFQKKPVRKSQPRTKFVCPEKMF